MSTSRPLYTVKEALNQLTLLCLGRDRATSMALQEFVLAQQAWIEQQERWLNEFRQGIAVQVGKPAPLPAYEGPAITVEIHAEWMTYRKVEEILNGLTITA